jgi:hypothetical protein
MLLSSTNETKHSQAIALDGASKVLIVADLIAISGTPNVAIKIQTSEDMVNWVTPVVGTPNQNELQLTAIAPTHGESGSPAGTAITVEAQYIRLVYTMTAIGASALIGAGVEVSRE